MVSNVMDTDRVESPLIKACMRRLHDFSTRSKVALGVGLVNRCKKEAGNFSGRPVSIGELC